MTTSFPPSWTEQSLGSILSLKYGKAHDKSKRRADGRYPVVGSAGVMDRTDEPLVREPIVVIGRKGNVGQPHLHSNGAWPTDTTYFAQVPESLDGHYLYWQLEALDLKRLDSSTATPSLRREDLEEQRLVVPPLDEQHRIVAILQDHLSRLEAGDGDLMTSRRRAQAARAGLLAEMWGAAERVARTRTVAAAGQVITGSTPSTRRGDVFGPGMPFVTPGDLSAGNPVRTSARSLSAAGEASARALPANSVLAVCIGATLGKCGWTERPVATNQQINALVLDEDRAMAAFVARLMASPQFQSEMRSRASTTTMPLLNKTAFSQLPLPIPPVGAQLSALSKFEAAEAGLARMNEAVTAAAGRAAALRKALLAAAFAGQL